MSPDTAPKLTKKQRKGLAFRQKIGKGKSTARPEPEDVPESENLDEQADLGLESSTRPESKDNLDQPERQVAQKDAFKPSKKRKRRETGTEEGVDPDLEQTANKPESKKRKRKDPETDENAIQDGEDGDSKSQKQNARYILFLGNLKYTTSKETVQAHFAHCDPPPTVRLLTPKTKSENTARLKSKGCAFLEFSHRNALQQALKLHHSTLDGRQINVELTAGGGGKSAARIDKVRNRNRELEKQRTTRKQKESTSADGSAPPPAPEHSQRHSSTSGTAETPATRRTWTVPEADNEGSHRGGVKHAKKRGAKKGGSRKEKALGTGVNAIPVG